MDAQLKLGAAAITAVLLAAGLTAACGDNNPTGPQTTTYVAQLSGAHEIPAVAGGATGTATFTLNGRTLSYVVTVNGLSANAAASHIHVGGAGTNGNIVVPFSAAAVQSGQVASGSIDLDQPISNGTTSITGDSLLKLLNSSSAYTNVHTANNPNGEIRGQITRMAAPSSGY